MVESAIEAHEDAARWVLGLGIAAGVLGLAGFWAAYARRLSVARALSWAATLVVVLEMGALIQTATLGGHIHRPELVSPDAPLERDPD